MVTRNSLSNYEVSIIKSLISQNKLSNQEIAGLINRSRGPAAMDISSGRISNIKNNQIKKYVTVDSASESGLSYFLSHKTSISEEAYDPISDAELAKIIRTKQNYPNHLDITETDRIECKSSVNIVMKTLAAFSNNKGGYFFFGIENKTWEILGIDANKFAELDFNKINQNILSSLGVGLEIQKRNMEISGKKIGVLYVAPAHIKPVIMNQNGDGFSQGQIYYRYPGEDRLITQTDLQRLIEDRIRQISETILSKHIANILKFGIENSAILDLNTGLVDGKAGNFIIDPELLPILNFIKEGEFVEKSGAPTLKLIGQIAPASVVVTKIQKLTELYPYSYRDISKKIKKSLPSATDSVITKFIKEQKLKQNLEFSSYNFRNKRQEDKYIDSKILPSNTPSIYNDKAIEYIVNMINKT